MIAFDKDDIEILYAYKAHVDQVVADFYQPGTSQPSTAVKEKFRSEYNFKPIDYGFETSPESSDDGFLAKIGLKGNVQLLTDNARQAGFVDVARFAHGETAVVFAGIKQDDEWQIIRVWNSDAYRGSMWYNDSPANLLPGQFLDAGDDIQHWSGPLLPLVDFGIDAEDIEPVTQAYHVMERIFSQAGLTYGPDLMGVMPNGVALYVDPGAGYARSDAVIKGFAQCKEALHGHPQLQMLFDYVDPQTGQWVQDRFFPRPKI